MDLTPLVQSPGTGCDSFCKRKKERKKKAVDGHFSFFQESFESSLDLHGDGHTEDSQGLFLFIFFFCFIMFSKHLSIIG